MTKPASEAAEIDPLTDHLLSEVIGSLLFHIRHHGLLGQVWKRGRLEVTSFRLVHHGDGRRRVLLVGHPPKSLRENLIKVLELEVHKRTVIFIVGSGYYLQVL